MIDRLERVLSSMLISEHPVLDGLNVVRKGNMETYQVTYLINSKLHISDAFKIKYETKNLFEMLNPKCYADILIEFERGNNYSDIFFK